MDFTEKYTKDRAKKYKTVAIALGTVAFCAVVLTITFGSSPKDSGPKCLALSEGSEVDLTILGEKSKITLLKISPPSRTLYQGKQPLVTVTGQGRLLGTTLNSRKGREYFAFYKVPYAQPPLGTLRFKPPQTPRRWRGIRDAKKPGPQCIQREKYAPGDVATGKEDCLFLNIYTPKLPENGGENPNLPVLFYLHGGGLSGNGTRYGAKYFMDEDAVLVTIEFRMGILGYFTTNTIDYAGNYGSKDQVFALKWVQQNIGKFGGDPKRVMIFGNSGGGAAVHSLLVSPMAKGLFSTAIAQSGSCIQQNSLSSLSSTEVNELLGKEVGCDPSNIPDFINCLRKVDAEKLVVTTAQTFQLGYSKEVIPENGDLSNTFFPDSPWNLIQQGRSHPVPTMFGDVSQEALSFGYHESLLNETSARELNTNWNDLLPTMVGISDDAKHTVAKKFRSLYFGDKEINNDTRVDLITLYSDSFVHSQRISALLHAHTTSQPVYLYWISKEPMRSYGEKYRQSFPPPYGVSHADELQYLFLYDGYPEITLDSPWFSYSQALVKIWVSFAASGKPQSPSEEWKQIAEVDKGIKWYELGDRFGEIEPVSRRMPLWDEYIDVLYVPK